MFLVRLFCSSLYVFGSFILYLVRKRRDSLVLRNKMCAVPILCVKPPGVLRRTVVVMIISGVNFFHLIFCIFCCSKRVLLSFLVVQSKYVAASLATVLSLRTCLSERVLCR